MADDSGEYEHPATVGECLTLGGHDGSPCSKCGWTRPARPPAIPSAALARERAKHPHRSSHFRSWKPDDDAADSGSSANGGDGDGE